MYLSLSFLALALGPLLVWIAKSQPWSTVSIDSFCLVTVSGFALLHLLPESAAQAGDVGWLVLPLALVGFLLPAIAERTLHHGHRGMRRTVLLLAFLGVAAHATLDGFFLASDRTTDDHGHNFELTAWAIILHRVPEGIGIWWIVPRTLGFLPAVAVSVVSVLATLAGYFLGDALITDTSQRAIALLQALLIGSLLHVVLHAHVPAPRNQGRFKIVSVLGGALGVFVLANVIHDHFPPGPNGGPMQVFVNLAMESAPALLLAYLLVGLCHVFMPANWLRRMNQGPAFVQALRGVAVGLPLPVCSCGVVPIYRELIRKGTAIAAAIAFLVATPELELAAVMLTWQLMGGEVALARMLMAAALALGVGVLVASFAGRTTAKAADEAGAMPATTTGTVAQRLRTAVRFGFGPAVDNTATWIVVGLLLSAMLMPYVDKEWFAALPAGLDVPIAALIGLPLYVCATGSTPLAAMLLVQGLSPGAVLALMLTGPATNITTFGVLARLHGARVAVVFAVARAGGAIGLGYLANWLLPTVQVAGFQSHEHGHSTLRWIALGALAAVFLFSLLRQGMRPFLERLFESPANLAHGEAAGCCDDDHGDGHGHHHHHHHGHSHPPQSPGALVEPTASQYVAVRQKPLAPMQKPPGGSDCCH